jgi:hypothetical protein
MVACTSKDQGTAVTQVDLNVSGAGGGAGLVSASIGGLSCSLTPTARSGSCLAQYSAGTVVVLTATPVAGSEFDGWSGACGGTSTCQLTLTATANVQATFGAAPQRVTVTGAGSGTGVVTSTPVGIACTSTTGTVAGSCDAPFAGGNAVVLTALANSASVFTGWGGDCTGILPSCTVMASASRSVQARFVAMRTVSVTGAGAGSGSIASSPPGISCAITAAVAGGDCGASYVDGTALTLTATPAAGSSFSGWSGACAGVAPACTVTVSAAMTATANFTPVRTLTVTGAGTGAGTVTSVPAGISCAIGSGVTSGLCHADYPDATSVSLSAAPTAGSTFAGWSGACSGTASCIVAMTAARAVTAAFTGSSSATTTTVAVSPASIVAGGSGATVTVTVRDAGGAPVPGATVSLSVVSGAPLTITQPATVTNASGLATGLVASNVAGPRTVAATIGGTVVAAQQPLVTVTAAAPSAVVSTLSVNASSLVAGGSSGSATVTVKDAFGNPVPGTTVTLAVAQGNPLTIIQPVGVTDANGVATGSLSSTGAGARTIVALIAGTTPVAQQAAVTVTAGAPKVIAQSGNFVGAGARFGQATPSLPAVLVTDDFANPVAGAGVVFTVTKGLAQLSNGTTSGTSLIVSTDATGVARLTSWVLTSVAAAGNYDPAIDVNNAVTATLAGVGSAAFNTVVTVSYASDLQSIWNASSGGCTASGCHSSSGGFAPTLVSGSSRAALTGNPAYWSAGDSTTISNSTNRLLYRLITGTPLMPSGSARLPANIVGIIKAYIRQGVPNN